MSHHDKVVFETWSIGLLFHVIVSVVALGLLIASILIIVSRLNYYLKLRALKKQKFQPNTKIVGFFHPNCDAGAGGEKVLWSAVQALQRTSEFEKRKTPVQILVYSGSKMEHRDILEQKVHQRFGIEIDDTNLHFVNLD